MVAMTASCRRQQPSLIDRNQPPDTQLWYAPPDSSDYEYKVHLYWRGTDNDGTANRFIWAIQDTIQGQGLSWNPALRLRDYRSGRITSRTDSTFSFTAYKNVKGVGVRKNRQAFFVAAIDDNGVIDPSPAAVEFVATIAELPQLHFTNYINGVARPYQYQDVPRDTVGMYHPFSISYHGTTVNGQVRGYQFNPLSTEIVLPGSGVWTDDLSDTLRSFPNTVDNPLPAGSFRFSAKCIDDAGAESPIDGGKFRQGVSQVVVNFDPDTWMTRVTNKAFYKTKPPVLTEINFTDNKPDTVPYKSWVTIYYYGHDDKRDTRLCSVADPDECINFNLRVIRQSERLGASGYENSLWLPRNAYHDSDANSTADSNSVNMGSFEYDVQAGAVDENGSQDGTPASVHIIGNFDPVMDTFAMKDQFDQTTISPAVIDTLDWNFYKGIGWPYSARGDTLQDDGVYYKWFGFNLHATGHDDKRDIEGSGIKTWRYRMFLNYVDMDHPGTEITGIGRAGISWFPGDALNTVDELAKVKLRYNLADGSDLFANLPPYMNKVVTLIFWGRDTRIAEPSFEEIIRLTKVPPGEKAGTVNEAFTINYISAEESGRWTQPRIVQFYLRFTK